MCRSLIRTVAYRPRPRYPDMHGLRYCRYCEEYLSLDRYDKGQRRNVCTACRRRVTQKYEKRPETVLLRRLYSQCYWDSMKVFKHESFGSGQLTYDDLKDLLMAANKWEPLCTDVAVIPEDATRVMTCDNIRLVTKCERKQFITAYQTAAIKQTLDKQIEAQSIRDSTPTVLKSMICFKAPTLESLKMRRKSLKDSVNGASASLNMTFVNY